VDDLLHLASSRVISRHAAPARASVSVICLLAVVNGLNSTLATLPRIASDIWLLRHYSLNCSFVLYASIEYAARLLA
jgi:hypothetical protein